MEIKDNKLVWLVGVMLGLVGFTAFFNNVVLDKIVARVIKKIEKPYSPSPFGPGLDQDKLDGHKGVSNWTNEWEAFRDQ